jgi:hypothetical protein
MCFTSFKLCRKGRVAQRDPARPARGLAAGPALACALLLGWGLGLARGAWAREQPPSHQLANALSLALKSPCFDRDSLAEEIERWLGRSRVDARVQRIRVRASQGTLSFSIDLIGQPPVARNFDDLPRDCGAQRRAIALSIALAVDAVEADLPAWRPPPTAGGSRPPPARWRLALQGMATTALPEKLGWGGLMSIERRVVSGVAVRLGMGAAFAGDQRLGEARAPRIEALLMAARAEGCGGLPLAERLEVALCAGFWGGVFSARAPDLVEPGRAMQGWWAAAVSPELRLALTPRWGMALGADLAVPLRGGVLQVLDMQGEVALSRPLPRVVGALRLGPVLSF